MGLFILKTILVLASLLGVMESSSGINVGRKRATPSRLLHILKKLDNQRRSVEDGLSAWEDAQALEEGLLPADSEIAVDERSLEHRSESMITRCSTGHSLTTGSKVQINRECRECGQRCCNKREKRIPGGQNAHPGEFPWHAAIFQADESARGWRFICGGALVSGKHVLTAAHCVSLLCRASPRRITQASEQYRVTLGETDIHLNRAGIRMRPTGLLRVASIGCHGSYRTAADGINHYDVAMLELKEKAHSPIACLTQSIIQINETRHCYGIGHGRTGSDQTYYGSSVLMKVAVNVTDAATCKARFGHNFDISSNVHACAHTGRHGAASCKLDSGSPILCPEDPQDPCSPYVIRGVYSNIANRGRCESNRVSYLTNLFGLSGWTPSQWAAHHIGFDLTSPTCDQD